MKGKLKMAEAKKQVKKNPNPLVVKGIFFVTADFEEKQYVVSNGLSFIRFKKEGEDIKKGDYIRVHGPVYQRKEAANPIITGEAIVEKLSEEEVDKMKAAISEAVTAAKAVKKSAAPKKEAKAKKADEQKFPWD